MLLRAENIIRKYNGKIIIDIPEFEVREGETAAVVGPSGTGKTTFFNILSGLDKPDSGSVIFKGRDITGKPGEVGYMQQKDLLLEHRKLLANLSFPLTLRGVSKSDAGEAVKKYLDEFGLGGCEALYPSQLSGGMRQRAALLRTFLFNSELVLLDEPFSALDEISRQKLHGWYRKICRIHRTSSVIITHSITEAKALADVIYIMSGRPGRLRRLDDPEKYSNEEILAMMEV